VHTGILWGNLTEDLGIDGRIILKMCLKRNGLSWDVDRIGLVQGRDRWRALVNAVMNVLVP
jgi:hypothetical protein